MSHSHVLVLFGLPKLDLKLGKRIYRNKSNLLRGKMLARKLKYEQQVDLPVLSLSYNWLMRTYITPEKINKFNSNIPDACFKCGQSKGTLFHCV